MPPEWRRPAPWLLAAAALIVAALLVLAGLSDFVQALAGLVLVVTPSLLLAWPLLRPRFGVAGAFAIASAFSIGMIVITGLLLNLLPWGLQRGTWLAYVAVVIALAFVIDRARIGRARATVEVHTHEVVLGVIGAGLLVSAFLVARLFSADPGESFTLLSISAASDAPTSAVVVRIESRENAPTGYRLEILRNGTLFTRFEPIQLTGGQMWIHRFATGSGGIEARLFRLSDTGTLYRWVRVQIAPAAQ